MAETSAIRPPEFHNDNMDLSRSPRKNIILTKVFFKVYFFGNLCNFAFSEALKHLSKTAGTLSTCGLIFHKNSRHCHQVQALTKLVDIVILLLLMYKRQDKKSQIDQCKCNEQQTLFVEKFIKSSSLMILTKFILSQIIILIILLPSVVV